MRSLVLLILRLKKNCENLCCSGIHNSSPLESYLKLDE